MNLLEKLQEAAADLHQHFDQIPKYALVLGSGLDTLVKELPVLNVITFEAIRHVPRPTVKGHEATISLVDWYGTKVLVVHGRLHYYEGYSMEEVTFLTRALGLSGIEHFLFTNATGSVNLDMTSGQLAIVTDHINTMPENPLRGPNDPSLGVRYPSMATAYDWPTIMTFEALAKEQKIILHKAIYLSLPGPNLETPAEYRAFQRMGADLIGMSTVPEVIVARHMRKKVTVLSIIANQAKMNNPILEEESIEDIIATVKSATGNLKILLDQWFKGLY